MGIQICRHANGTLLDGASSERDILVETSTGESTLYYHPNIDFIWKFESLAQWINLNMIVPVDSLCVSSVEVGSSIQNMRSIEENFWIGGCDMGNSHTHYFPCVGHDYRIGK